MVEATSDVVSNRAVFIRDKTVGGAECISVYLDGSVDDGAVLVFLSMVSEKC